MKNRNITIQPEWYSEDLAKDNQWLKQLSLNETHIIYNAINAMKSGDSDTFHSLLSQFEPLFKVIFENMLNKFGFLVVRGFPKPNKNISTEELKKFYMEFCKYLGSPLIQNKNLDLLFDVKYIQESENNKNARGAEINDALPLHADHGGLLGMYCLTSADIGGHTLLASTYTVHREIEKRNPDLLDVLYQSFYGDRRGHEPLGALPYDHNPIFAVHEDKLMCQYAGYYLDDTTEKFPNIPPITQQQRDAINLFCEIADRKDIQFEIKLESGDMIFINNNRVLHGRTRFHVDKQIAEVQRHLLRIWLSTPKIKSFPHYYGYPIP